MPKSREEALNGGREMIAPAMIAQLKYGTEPHSTGWNNSKVSWEYRYRRRRNQKL